MIIVDRIKEIATSSKNGVPALVIINVAFALNVWSYIYIFSDPIICGACNAGFITIIKAGIKFDKHKFF